MISSQEETVLITKKHSLAVRWFHWLNFPLLTVMIWSGMLIYWANDEYYIQLGSLTLKFFPQWFYKALNIPFRLSVGMAWHFTFMWFFAINGVGYFIYLILSREYKSLFPKRNSLIGSLQVTLYDFGLKKTKPIQGKYNDAQRVIYTVIILLGGLMLLTGLAIYKPIQQSWLTTSLGGYVAARLEHFIITIIFVAFFVVHIAQVVKAGWRNFQSMVTGVDIADTETQETIVVELPKNINPTI